MLVRKLVLWRSKVGHVRDPEEMDGKQTFQGYLLWDPSVNMKNKRSSIMWRRVNMLLGEFVLTCLWFTEQREINGESDDNDDDVPKVLLQKPQYNLDVTYFLPGNITSLTSAPSFSCSSKGPLRLEDISNSIITYAISKSHIALVLSVKAPQGIRVSI